MSKKVLDGVVVSDKSDKTIIVQVVRTYMHQKYKKIVKSRSKYAVHDPENKFKIGDKLKIIESRPISKTKCWIVSENIQSEIKQ